MKTGFGHFDSSHRENFCAAVLLLAMEVDDAVKELVARLVRERLGIDPSTLLSEPLGREARLTRRDRDRLVTGQSPRDDEAGDDEDDWARADLCLRFKLPKGDGYAFVELKTHGRWKAADVANQLRDQSERKVARGRERDVLGCVLLAPERLCRLVQAVDPQAHVIPWPNLLEALRTLHSQSVVTELAIQHLEETMERPAGLDRPITLEHFKQATTTIACLREFLLECIADIGGSVHGAPLYMTPGDGKPRRGGGWAWHGLSVPFARNGRKGRVGLYRFTEAPAGEQGDLSSLWLEAYVDEDDKLVASIPFAPPTLAAKELDAVRTAFTDAWGRSAVDVEPAAT